MKNTLLILALALAFIAGLLCNFPAHANETDDFSTGTLNHGIAFDHTDTFASINFNDPPLPVSHFEPGRINLSDVNNAGINVNGLPVIVQPSSVPEIPEATTENQVEVLNQMRRVLIDAKLATVPE